MDLIFTKEGGWGKPHLKNKKTKFKKN